MNSKDYGTILLVCTESALQNQYGMDKWVWEEKRHTQSPVVVNDELRSTKVCSPVSILPSCTFWAVQIFQLNSSLEAASKEPVPEP